MTKQNNFHQPDPTKQGGGDGNDAIIPGPGTGDMLKSVYDSNDDGRVDSADHATTANTADDLADNPGFELYYGYDSFGVKGWHGLALVQGTFIAASDTPSSYSGQALKVARVNAGETALEFFTFTPGASAFTGLSDTPANFTGSAKKLPRVNSGETALEFIDHELLISIFAASTLDDNELFASYIATKAFKIPASATDSQGYAEAAATGAVTVDLKKNGTNFGTVNWAASANAATFTVASETSFAAGDRLTAVLNGTADATLADIGITLKGIL